MSTLSSVLPLEIVFLEGLIGAVLCWPGGKVIWSEYSHFSYPSNWSSLVLMAQGMLQLHLQVLGSLQWCLVYEQLVVDLLVRGTEVRKDLCCHLDNVTHLPGIVIWIITYMKHYDFTGLFSKEELWKWIIGSLDVASLLLISRLYWVLMMSDWVIVWIEDALLSLDMVLILGIRKMSAIQSEVRLAS